MVRSLSKPADWHSDLPSGLLELFQLEGPARPLGSAGGFSGACFWLVEEGDLNWALRRWPQGDPSARRLEWIHSVLDHAHRRGFQQLPIQRPLRDGRTFLEADGHLWEASCWMPGEPLRLTEAGSQGLCAATATLARFHQAVADCPLPEGQLSLPTVQRRREYLEQLTRGRAVRIQLALEQSDWQELQARGRQIMELFFRGHEQLAERLEHAAANQVQCQPCLRDVWYRHILMLDGEVSSLIDFGSLGIDSVATDVARLLGSLTGPGHAGWQEGLDSYQQVRRLSEQETRLIVAIQQANQLMAGIKWLDWILLEAREFADPAEVLARLDELVELGSAG